MNERQGNSMQTSQNGTEGLESHSSPNHGPESYNHAGGQQEFADSLRSLNSVGGSWGLGLRGFLDMECRLRP